MEWIIAQESPFRLAAFLGVLALMALWEQLAPRRRLRINKAWRWSSNVGMVVLGTILVRVLFPASAVGAALFAEEAGWGVFNQVDVPSWAAAVLSVLLMDLAVWAQHVLFHAVPSLWRIHRVHHADLDFDVTTGVRFHPAELVLSMIIKFAVVVALGAPAVAVVMFEVVLNATSMFNHGNVRLWAPLDRALRWILVTPDMHRVHHSWHPDETNSNFGFNLSWWDRLAGTYVAQPQDGHEQMTIGLKAFRNPGDLRLDRMLVQPFLGRLDYHPIRFGRRSRP